MNIPEMHRPEANASAIRCVMSTKEMRLRAAAATAARFIMYIPGMKRLEAVATEKKWFMPMREARTREESAIRQFIIVMVIPAMQREVIMIPARAISNIILMIVARFMIGTEMDMGVTALGFMNAEGIAILPVERTEALRATAFPAA